MSETPLSELLGKTCVSVENIDNKVLLFTTEDGERYKLNHHQDCCESVEIEDIDNDLNVLVGSPILVAEESTNTKSHPEGFIAEWEPASFTWTFYKFATAKGHVTVRWYGESNGYYSESVSFEVVE